MCGVVPGERLLPSIESQPDDIGKRGNGGRGSDIQKTHFLHWAITVLRLILKGAAAERSISVLVRRKADSDGVWCGFHNNHHNNQGKKCSNW